MLRRLDSCWKFKRFFHGLKNSVRIENPGRDDGNDQKKLLAFEATTAFCRWRNKSAESWRFAAPLRDCPFPPLSAPIVRLVRPSSACPAIGGRVDPVDGSMAGKWRGLFRRVPAAAPARNFRQAPRASRGFVRRAGPKGRSDRKGGDTQQVPEGGDRPVARTCLRSVTLGPGCRMPTRPLA